MTTRQDHEFSNFANIPICIQPGKGLQTRGVGWEQQPASAPSSPSLPFLPWLFLTAALLHPPSHGEGNMPHGKSREAGRAGLLRKELTQHWERPSCNKARKAHAQQQSTKLPVPAAQRPARPSRTSANPGIQLPVPTHLSTHRAALCPA